MVDEKTPYLSLPLPHADNQLRDDVERLRQSLRMVDLHTKQSDDAGAQRDIALSELGQNLATTAQTASGAQQAAETAQQTAADNLETAKQAVEGEKTAREEAVTGERTARNEAITAHDDNTAAHGVIFQNITVGGLSPIMGICRVETGGGGGLWFNVDAEGNPISPNPTYFNTHPVWGKIQRVVIDNQVMGQIPQFWVKDFTPQTGVFKGKPCKLLSPGQQDGFRIHPAFMNHTARIPHFFLGCFACTDEGGSPKKAGSRPGKAPLVSVNFDTMKSYITNRNTGGVSGFMMWDVYQWAAVTTLMLIEKGTADMQSAIGRGHCDGSAAIFTDATTQPDWRGFRGLWGNVWQMVDGVGADGSKKTKLFRNDGSRTWVNTGWTMPAGNPGWPITMKSGTGDGYNFDDMYLPATVSGDATGGSYNDAYWGPVANAVCYTGGSWDYGSYAGPFCLAFDGAASNSHAYIGARLAKV